MLVYPGVELIDLLLHSLLYFWITTLCLKMQAMLFNGSEQGQQQQSIPLNGKAPGAAASTHVFKEDFEAYICDVKKLRVDFLGAKGSECPVEDDGMENTCRQLFSWPCHVVGSHSQF